MVIDEKFKDRKPSETIKIVKDFFEKRNFQLKIIQTVSEIKTYGYVIKLFIDNYFIFSTNGKGVTDELALASGLAEMYERFCNFMPMIWSQAFFEKLQDVSYQENGYYLDPNEKIKDLKECFEEFYVNDFFNTISNHNELIKYKLLQYTIGKRNVCIPYKNILSNEVKYLNPNIITHVFSSVGMSAGNTYKEAFIQGFSECLERYVLDDAIQSPNITYYCINLHQFEGTKLGELINNILNKGYDFYLIDMSYEYEIPVVTCILIDKIHHTARMNTGSHPIFEIAAERTITEIYQNVTCHEEEYDVIQTPSKNFVNPNHLIYECSNNFGLLGYIPMNFFQNKVEKNTFNKEVYISNNSSIEELFNYYLNLIKKFDLNVYVADRSKDSRLYALHIYIENLMVMAIPYEYVNYSQIHYKDILKFLEAYTQAKKCIENNKYFPDNFLSLKNNFKINIDSDNILIFSIALRDWCYPFYFNLSSIFDIFNLNDVINDDKVLNKYKNLFNYNDLKKFFILKRYKISNYSNKEIIAIGKYLGMNINELDIKNCLDVEYILDKAILYPYWEMYHSEKYYNIIKKFI